MKKLLADLCLNKSMVSVYTDFSETDKFHFGRILAVNEREIAIHMLSPDGEDDGIIVMNVNNVFRIEENGEYSEKMKKLYSTKQIPEYILDIKNDDIKKAVVMYAFQNKLIASIELIDSGVNDIVGFVEALDDSMCKFRQVDDYGYEDGFSYVSVDDITMVTVLSQDEKRVQTLWQLNSEQNL